MKKYLCKIRGSVQEVVVISRSKLQARLLTASHFKIPETTIKAKVKILGEVEETEPEKVVEVQIGKY